MITRALYRIITSFLDMLIIIKNFLLKTNSIQCIKYQPKMKDAGLATLVSETKEMGKRKGWIV